MPAAARCVSDRASAARNTARVLKEFGYGRPGERGVTELSRRLGLGKSTVHRILTALVAEHLLEHDPLTRTYRLALTAIDLGAAAAERLQLREASMPSLVRLHQRTHQTVNLGVLDGTDVVYVERLVRRNGQPSATAHKTRVRAHYSSCGKAIMAFLPDATSNAALMARPLDACTRFTTTDPVLLRGELRMVRARGWSCTVNEHEIGIASLGAPVRDQAGQVVAAVSVVRQLRACTEEDLRPYLDAVLTTATAISQRLSRQTQFAS